MKKKSIHAEKEALQKLSSLEDKIGYVFKDKYLLRNALIHSSYSNEHSAKGDSMQSNERLEFLGDSVLSIIASEYLYKKMRRYPEGEMSRVRSAMVCENSLYEIAKSIELGDYLYLSKGEENTQGRQRKSILADAFEALLGSMFLDGGFAEAKVFLTVRFDYIYAEIIKDGDTRDYKTVLQQIIQQNRGDTFEYRLAEQKGPAHNRQFIVHAVLNGNIIGKGIGVSKREAEQEAAHEALKLFGEFN